MAELEIVVNESSEIKMTSDHASYESICYYIDAIGRARKDGKIYFCDVELRKPSIIIEALEDLGVRNAKLFSDGALLKLPERFGQQLANIVIPWSDGDMGFMREENGVFKPFIPFKENPLAMRILSKKEGGTGELARYYVRRTVLDAIRNAYAHVLKEFSVDDKSFKFKVTCR